MKRVIYIISAVILLSFLITSCEVEEIDRGPFKVTVKNRTCTSWTIKEDGKEVLTINKSSSSDSYTSSSFMTEQGEHTYDFSPDPDTCFFSGSIFGYVYKQDDVKFDVDKDITINIGTYMVTIQ